MRRQSQSLLACLAWQPVCGLDELYIAWRKNDDLSSINDGILCCRVFILSIETIAVTVL